MLQHEHNISSTEKFNPDRINYYNTTKSGVDVLDKIVREYSVYPLLAIIIIYAFHHKYNLLISVTTSVVTSSILESLTTL